MSNYSPITPPKDLLQQLRRNADTWLGQITIAYQAGADMELEACCEWIPIYTPWDENNLRIARRPHPPSLKEQALEAQRRMWSGASNHDDWDLVRRALEQLPD